MNYEYCDGITHTIKQGETLYSLSRYYKVPLAILLRANPYIDVYNLQIGDTICVPVKSPRNTKNTGNANTSQSCKNTGMNMMPINMDMGAGMAANMNMGMSAGMQDIPNVNVDMEENMPMETGMDMDNTDNMSSMNTMGDSMPESDSTNMDTSSKEKEKCWIKYVAQSGDTLQDIFDRSDCSREMFWSKNSADRMYMLPGVAYFILEND